MILSYKTRLEPNNKQAQKLKQFAGAARYAYNWAIAKEKEAYELGNGFIGENELRRIFTRHKEEADWLYTISNDVTKQAIKDAATAFQIFLKAMLIFLNLKPRERADLLFIKMSLNLKQLILI